MMPSVNEWHAIGSTSLVFVSMVGCVRCRRTVSFIERIDVQCIYNVMQRGTEEIPMAKTAVINARIDPVVKERAEGILSELGISASGAITIYRC